MQFPFASTVEGGLTPNGEGASLLCAPEMEQRSKCYHITYFVEQH